jgi:primary-amine oxidase
MRNKGIVVWYTFGTTHNPWVEDWPVMLSEKIMVTLKPVNFFERNLGINIKASR